MRVPRFVHPAPGVTLWAHMVPGPATDPVLLVADAGASLALWPQPLISALAAHHPVLCYDHRDTGRSRTSAAADPGHAGATAAADPDPGRPRTTAAVDADPDLGPERPAYGVATLAADALAVLDAYEVARAHVLGWGMGGLVAQLLLLDHPARLASATLVATRPLRAPGAPALPGPPTALRRLWAELDDPRDREGELAWRVAHDRLLHGAALPFDAAAFRARHERAMAHAGTEEPVTAHTHLAVPSRGAELAAGHRADARGRGARRPRPPAARGRRARRRAGPRPSCRDPRARPRRGRPDGAATRRDRRRPHDVDPHIGLTTFHP